MHNELGLLTTGQRHGCQMAMPLGMVAKYDKSRCSCNYERNYLSYWCWEI